MSDDLEEFIQAQKVKLAQARKSHGIKSPEIHDSKLPTNSGPPPQTAGYFGSNPQGAPDPDYFVGPPPAAHHYPPAPGRDDGLKFGEYDEKKKLYQEQRKAETRDFFAKDKKHSRKPPTGREEAVVAQGRGGASMPFQDDVVAKRQKEFERNREYNEFLSNKVATGGQSRARPSEDAPGSFFPDPDKENENRLRNERNREYNDYLRRKQEHERLKKANAGVPEDPVNVGGAKPIVYQPVFNEAQNAPRYVMPPQHIAPPPAQMPNYEEMLRQKAEEERKYRQPPAGSMAHPPQFVSQQYMVAPQAMGMYHQPVAAPQSQGQRGARRLPPVEDLEARMQTYDFELGKRKQMLKEDHRNSALNVSLNNQYSSDPSLNMLESGKYMNGDMFLDDRLMGHFGSKMRGAQEDPSMRFDDMGVNYGAPPPMATAAPSRFTGGAGGGGGYSGPSGSVAPMSGPAPGGPPDPQFEKKRKQQEYKKALVAQMQAQEAARKIEKEKNMQINLTGDKDASKLQMEYMRGGGVSEYPFTQQQLMMRPGGPSKPLDGSSQLISKPLDMWATGSATAPSFDATYNYFANTDPLDPMVAPRGMLGLDTANGNSSGSQTYQAELLQQMREKQDRQYKQKLEHERWEKKKDAEDSYFPFGKGGAGAPLRDADGNIIADLRELHHIAETNKQPSVRNDYHGQLTETLSARPNESYSGAPVSSRDPAAPQFARGKIFNDPMPKHQLSQQEQYKLDLKRQMEEKQSEKEKERKKQAEEDEKEEAKIREQMAQIQAEYEREQEKIRRKAEEQQKKNEEMRAEAEQKRLALERARKEEEEQRAEERRRDMERELEERRRAEQARKPASPPLPAQQKAAPVPVQEPKPAPQPKPPAQTPAVAAEGAESVNIPSHPVRLVKGKATGRDPSRAEVNRQLSAMRQQLMSEQRRIEMQIENKNTLGLNHVQYPLDVKSIDAELFRRELDTEKEQRSRNTAGREFPIAPSSASARQLPPLMPPYHSESTSSSLADDYEAHSLALGRPSTVGIVPKNVNHSSSTPVYNQPRKSTTPRRGPQGGSRLFSRTKSLPPTAVPFEENGQMPHILEEFDLSPKETRAQKPSVEKKDQATTTTRDDEVDPKPQEDEFNVSLLNPPEVSRPDSENLIPESERYTNLPTPRQTSSTPRQPSDAVISQSDAGDRPNQGEVVDPGFENHKSNTLMPPSDPKRSSERSPTPSIEELRDIVQDVTHNLSNQSLDLEDHPAIELENERNKTPTQSATVEQNQNAVQPSASTTGAQQTPVDAPKTQVNADGLHDPEAALEQTSVTQGHSESNPDPSRTNTVSEATVVLREPSEHGNLMNNGGLNDTKSTALPNFDQDTTILESEVDPVPATADSSTLQPTSFDDTKAASDNDHGAGDQSNDLTNNQTSNLGSDFPSLAQPRMGILKTPSNSILKKDSSTLSDANSLPGPSSLPDNTGGEYTPADVERSEGVLRRDPTDTDPYLNRETVGQGSDNVALGYLAAAQAETDNLKPITAGTRKRQMKSVRFFEVIEDDPYRPEELRDFAIPINNKMPPRLKTLPQETEASVFEDIRGHGPYPDSARLAYISTKMDDDAFRQSLVSRGQVILPGPDENAMNTSLMIDKPAWIENSNLEAEPARVSKSRERPWVDSFSKKEVQNIEQKFSGKAIVRPPRQHPPTTDLILTEPGKVRRPTQLESWNPIFKDEPNEAALDLFLHSKYDPLTRSRDNFRQQFPNAPQSSDMLEVQQRELIRQQERELLRLRKGDPGDDLAVIREDDLNFLIDHPDTKSMPLASDSAYIGINGDTLIPTPPLMTKIERLRDRRKMDPGRADTPPDNITNAPKLKDFLPSPPSSAGGFTKPRLSHQLSNNVLDIPDVEDVTLPFEPFQAEKSFTKNEFSEKQLPNPDTLSLGSNFSFDVDAVARKNKERLRKLENSNDADTLSVTDPDEVLRKFVDHDLNPKAVRPMSTMTNDTDPDWLKPS